MTTETEKGAGTVVLALPRGREHEQELRLVVESYEGHPYLRLAVFERDGDAWQQKRGSSVTVRRREIAAVGAALSSVDLDDPQLCRRAGVAAAMGRINPDVARRAARGSLR